MIYPSALPRPSSSRAARFAPALIAAALAVPASPGEPPLLDEGAVAALASELSGTTARETVQELTRHHRMRGSRGFRAAAEAIRDRALTYGLEATIVELPADGEVFYGTQRSRPPWDAEFAELWELREADGEWVDNLRVASWDERPITLAQDSASGEATANLVDVGAGTSPADYEGKDVAGQLVLTSSQPGAVSGLALERGAAGIVSYAQNQRSAWWGEDRNLVRWGHLDTFPPPPTFAFMVTVNQAQAWRGRLARGERVRLRAEVRSGQHPGAYSIPMAVLPGADPEVAGEEVVFSCHLDHQRPGANDNASGCATILEVARAISKLVREGKLAPPRRTLRFVWPPEIEGTIALLNARPEIAERAKAVIHLDMVGGRADVTKSIFHVTRSPASLPTFVNDVAEAFGRFVNEESYTHSAGGEADYPLVDPEGTRQALLARMASFSAGSDHQVWAEGSFRVPAIYLNDWPDRYIHTHADQVSNIDPTKLLRAAFIAGASGYYLAGLGDDGTGELLGVLSRHGLERTARVLERSASLDGAEARNLLARHLDYEAEVFASIAPFADVGVAGKRHAEAALAGLRRLVGPAVSIAAAEDGRVCRRNAEPKGPMSGFGYGYLADHLARHGLERPGLLDHEGLWGGDYAYEVLNLVDGKRTVSAIRDAVAAIYGGVPLGLVAGYLEALETIGVLACEAAPERTPRVLYFGIDGVRSDALKVARTPHLDSLAADGAITYTAEILGPRDIGSDTVSGPAWSSILTGVWADKHAVTDNTFDRGGKDAYPDFFHRVEATRPEAFTASVVSWPQISDEIVTGADFDEIRLPEDEDYQVGDRMVAAEAGRLFAEEDPAALFVYFGNVDMAGHGYGYHPETAPYVASIEEADALVGEVVAAVRKRESFAREDWLVLVVTDHGGLEKGHGGGHEVPEIRRTPMIVSGAAAARGEIEGSVYLVDAPVTALVHLGVAIDPSWGLDGRPVGLLAPGAEDP